MVWLDWWWVTVGSVIILIIFILVELKAYKEEQKKDRDFKKLIKSVNAKLDKLIKNSKKEDNNETT